MSHIIHEVTGLFPIRVEYIYTPTTIEEIQDIVKKEKRKISIGGGRYSMGGQTAVIGGVQIDMRQMSHILHLDIEKKEITVESGITWRDIQDYIDPYDLSVMTMQTYSNFTVGGSLSVNVHGRYIGYGPIILSVKEIGIILANGEYITASRTKNVDIFYGAIGGYGGIGIIVTATLYLKDNIMLKRRYDDMGIEVYGEWFRKHVRDDKKVIFHNADIYPPYFSSVRATSWEETDTEPTTHDRMIPRGLSYGLHRRVYSLMTRGYTPITHMDYGKWSREHIIDPLVYRKTEVHSRNYEASYDVAELEPKSRKHDTYVLEEYFCPVDKINEFVPKMREIFMRHGANILNVSIRHALPDDGSLLAWAREEVFAFVVYYNQETTLPARREVAVWTRELIDAIISVGGGYYLPYQLHGTLTQVKSAYPRFDEYVVLKQKYDPEGKFSNALLEKYYFGTDKESVLLSSRFHTIYDTEKWRDKFYIFLQNIFHIAPTHLFHSLIWDITDAYKTDKEIYTYIQKKLPTIKPVLADARYGIPALTKQKREMARQTGKLLGKKKKYNGYLEVGGAGRYIAPITEIISITGPIYLLSDEPIDFSPVRILERGQIQKYNTVKLTYSPLDISHIDEGSLDLITVFIGLHHAPLEKLDKFISSLASKLRSGGTLILRDHNVVDPMMHNFVEIAHDIYNAGTGADWEINEKELRYFRSIQEWKDKLSSFGFSHVGEDILQDNDPTDNTLMRFDKM